MISFIPLELTPGLLFFIGVYYLVVIMLFWRNNISKYDTFKKPQYLLLFLIFIHLLFAFEGGDYFHYYEDIVTKDLSEQEEIYTYIAVFAGYNYLIYRTIVWGGALWMFFLTTKRFRIDSYKAVFLLYLLYFTIFDYARATLAMSVFYYGFSFICIPIKKQKILSRFLLAPFIMLTSIFFHKGMIILIVSSFMIFVPLNRKGLFILLIILCATLPLLSNLFYIALNLALNSSGGINDKIVEYAEQVMDME